MAKKTSVFLLSIFLLFLGIFIIYYSITKMNKSSSDCGCGCDKEGFSLLQARQKMTQMAGGSKSLTAINTSLKKKLKNTKNKFTGFKNYVDVNYYYDKINNFLS